MKISIVQFKSELGAVDENFSTATRLIEAAKNSDVIVLPELWSTGYYPTPVENFADEGGEGLAVVRAKKEDTIDSIHDYIYKQVSTQRTAGEGEGDSTDAAMDMLNKLPRWIGKTAVRFIMWLDKHGWVPNDMIASDPYYQSAVLTNLGSIKLHSGYHHLTNWGTNSLFVIVGERKQRPFWNADGSFEMKDSIDLGLTVDERIADGYYFSKSVKLLIKLLENPQLLELPLSEEVEF